MYIYSTVYSVQVSTFTANLKLISIGIVNTIHTGLLEKMSP